MFYYFNSEEDSKVVFSLTISQSGDFVSSTMRIDHPESQTKIDRCHFSVIESDVIMLTKSKIVWHLIFMNSWPIGMLRLRFFLA
jgi:hypothetical protein